MRMNKRKILSTILALSLTTSVTSVFAIENAQQSTIPVTSEAPDVIETSAYASVDPVIADIETSSETALNEIESLVDSAETYEEAMKTLSKEVESYQKMKKDALDKLRQSELGRKLKSDVKNKVDFRLKQLATKENKRIAMLKERIVKKYKNLKGETEGFIGVPEPRPLILPDSSDSDVAELERYTPAQLKQWIQAKRDRLRQGYKLGDRERFRELGRAYKRSGDTSIKAFVNGVVPDMDVQPFVEGGRALVPIRAIVASMKADVSWTASTRTVTIKRGDTTAELQIGSKTMTVNGETKTLEVPAIEKNGRVFVPLRAIAVILGATVDYQEEGNIVIVEDAVSAPEVDPNLEDFPVIIDDIPTTLPAIDPGIGDAVTSEPAQGIAVGEPNPAQPGGLPPEFVTSDPADRIDTPPTN